MRWEDRWQARLTEGVFYFLAGVTATPPVLCNHLVQRDLSLLYRTRLYRHK